VSVAALPPGGRAAEGEVALGVALPAPVLDGYTAAQRAFAVAAWPLRAAEELRSALIYRALASASRAAGLPAPWPARFAEVVGDEVRHARLCATVGARLGAGAPRYDAGPVRRRLAPLAEPIARTAALLCNEVAIGETISMTLFRAGRRATREPLTRAALASIAGDEVRHQRLGWDGLAALWPVLDAAHREALQREATTALAASEQQIAVPVLRRLEAGEPFDPRYSELGVLAPEVRVETFYAAVERLVVPRLDRVGLDGGRAWRERYRGV